MSNQTSAQESVAVSSGQRFQNQSCRKLGQKLLEQDKFGSSFTMKLDGGKSYLHSWMGSICSLFLLAVVASYSF